MSRLILHVDMNAFFASCEQAVHPELRNRPIIVGGDPKTRKGIVLAASYEARYKGVKTAMLVREALRLCPEAEIVRSTHKLYSQMSKSVMALFDDFTPLKQQGSIDEAFLDMTGTEHIFGDYRAAAKKIQTKLLKELNLPCSIGIAHNKLLAKMGSDYKKPLGITTLFKGEVKEKLWPLKVGALYGVGRKSVPRLEALGIKTIGDLAVYDVIQLIEHFGQKSGEYMHKSANGLGSDRLNESKVASRSVGNELTYSTNISSTQQIKREILLLSDQVGHRLRKSGLTGKTISVKIRFNDFTTITRSKTLIAPTHHTDTIYDVAMALIEKAGVYRPIRLLGVTVTNFKEDTYNQLSLFEMETVPEHPEVDHMVDHIREKYGYDMIGRARLLKKK